MKSAEALCWLQRKAGTGRKDTQIDITNGADQGYEDVPGDADHRDNLREHGCEYRMAKRGKKNGGGANEGK